MAAGEQDGGRVRVAVDQGVATVWLDRPQRHNSLVPRLLTELSRAFRRLGDDDTVDVIVLRAEGPSFSTGGDVAALYAQGQDIGAYADELVGALNDAIIDIIECARPVIAAVHGQVTGGALGLVLAADIVIVTERASFAPWYVDVGFSPDGGWTALLPAVIGRNRALAVQLLNDPIGASRAVRWGLAYAMVPDNRLDTQIDELCRRIAAKRPGSLFETRRLMRPADYRERLDEERRRFVRHIATEEARAGMARFLDR